MKRLPGFARDPLHIAICLVLPVVVIYATRIFWFGNFDPTSIAYLINYQEFGFIKRGLVGSLLKTFGIAPTGQTLMFISAFLVFAWCAAAVIFFRWATRDSGVQAPFVRQLALLCVLSPCTFMHFALSRGRFDTINVILLMAALMALPKGRGWYAGVLAAAGILIHEAFIFTAMPVLLAAALTHAPSPPPRPGPGKPPAAIRPLFVHFDRLNWRPVPGLLALPLVVTLLLALFGTYEEGGQRLIAKLRDIGLDVDDPWAGQVWTRSVADNIHYTFWFHASGAGENKAAWLILIAVAWFYMRVFIRAFGPGLLMLAPLGIAPLFVLGVDTYRWVALAVTNLFIVGLVMIKRGFDVHSADFAPKRTLRLGMLLCLLGPFGAHRSTAQVRGGEALDVLLDYFAK